MTRGGLLRKNEQVNWGVLKNHVPEVSDTRKGHFFYPLACFPVAPLLSWRYSKLWIKQVPEIVLTQLWSVETVLVCFWAAKSTCDDTFHLEIARRLWYVTVNG